MRFNYERMGRIIKAVRVEREISQADLAELVDLSVPYMSQLTDFYSAMCRSAVIVLRNCGSCFPIAIHMKSP